MHVTDKHKMKDDVYLSQGKKRNGIGAVLFICDILFLEKQKRSEVTGAHTFMHTEAIWKVVAVLTKKG